MNSPTPPELFSQRPIRSDFGSRRRGRRRLLPLALVLVVFLASGIVTYYKLSTSTSSGEIPTIKAEGNAKQRPDQPGGLEIPHQDMLVFDQIEKSEKDKAAPVEHLLPPPEMPQVNSAPVQGVSGSMTQIPESALKPNAAEEKKLAAAEKPKAEPESPVSVAPAPSPVSPAPAPAPTPAPVAATAAATPQAAPAQAVQAAKAESKKELVAVPAASPSGIVVDGKKPSEKTVDKDRNEGKHLPSSLFDSAQKATQAKATEETSAPTATGKGPSVQLASSPDESAAKEMAEKYQSKLSGSLGGVKLRVVRADLGAKGVFYRVQGPTGSESDARALCAKIKSTGISCIIAR
jgi:hypothetical protein